MNDIMKLFALIIRHIAHSIFVRSRRSKVSILELDNSSTTNAHIAYLVKVPVIASDAMIDHGKNNITNCF